MTTDVEPTLRKGREGWGTHILSKERKSSWMRRVGRPPFLSSITGCAGPASGRYNRFMSTTVAIRNDHTDELARLFYSFRMAHLNRRYYSERLKTLKKWDTGFSIVVTLTTATSFALLSFADFSGVKTVAAIFAVIAFLASVSVPGLRLDRRIDDASTRICAFHYAAQQLESAIRFVKNSDGKEGEIAGWVNSAEEAYHQAAALPDTEAEDRKLIKKVEEEINESFPSNYVWTAF